MCLCKKMDKYDVCVWITLERDLVFQSHWSFWENMKASQLWLYESQVLYLSFPNILWRFIPILSGSPQEVRRGTCLIPISPVCCSSVGLHVVQLHVPEKSFSISSWRDRLLAKNCYLSSLIKDTQQCWLNMISWFNIVFHILLKWLRSIETLLSEDEESTDLKGRKTLLGHICWGWFDGTLEREGLDRIWGWGSQGPASVPVCLTF